jgi:phosphate transport system substrate-binding protein
MGRISKLPHKLALEFALACSVLASGCGRTNVITVDGSSTVFLISAAVAEQFNDVNPAVKVVVSQSGTGGGFKKFAAGELDICDASREITPEEAKACQEAGIEFVRFQVAFDGLAVVVNPQNDWCDALTVEQLKTIWRKESEGSIERWSDVNPDWPQEPLKLYGPGHDSGTYDYFNEVINGDPKNCRTDYSPSENDNALVLGVAGDKGSLGYFGHGYYEENKDKLKLLAVDAGDGPKKPTPESVRDGSYQPLSRPLFIYVRRSSLQNAGVAEFLTHYLEHAGELAPRVGYTAVTDDIAGQNQEELKNASPPGTEAAGRRAT